MADRLEGAPYTPETLSRMPDSGFIFDTERGDGYLTATIREKEAQGTGMEVFHVRLPLLDADGDSAGEAF